MLSNLYRDVRELVCPLKLVRTEQHVSARWINAGDQSALTCSLRPKNLVGVPFTTLKGYLSIRRWPPIYLKKRRQRCPEPSKRRTPRNLPYKISNLIFFAHSSDA